MNITFIHASNPYTPAYGGVEVYIKNIIHNINNKSYLINRNITFDLIGIGSKYLFNKNPNKLFNKFYSVNNKSISNFNFMINLFKKIKNINLNKYSILHAQRIDSLLPFILYKYSNRMVCTLHGAQRKNTYYKKGIIKGMIYDIIELFCINRIDILIAVDTDTYNYYTNRFPHIKDKIHIIPNGVDLNIFHPYSKNKLNQIHNNYGFNNFSPKILFVGRLEKEKNILFLLKVYHKVQTYFKNAIFIIVGDGHEKENLKYYIKINNIKNVILLGKVSQIKLVDIYNLSNLLVIGSKFEASPTTIREAIACNIPVVTTDVGDIKKLFQKIEGIKIVSENIDNFSMTVIDILSKNKTYNFDGIIDQFNIRGTVKSTIEVYNSLINKNI